MTWEPRRLPNVTPETERFWQAAVDGEFLLRECEECGLTYYYPRNHCPDCLSPNVRWREADGTGEVYSYTITEQVPNCPDDELPLVIGYVELDEGPRVLTNIVNCDPDSIGVGARVSARYRPTEEDNIAIPVFELVE
jgi:uncharacterized OB-fold protein